MFEMYAALVVHKKTGGHIIFYSNLMTQLTVVGCCGQRATRATPRNESSSVHDCLAAHAFIGSLGLNYLNDVKY